MNHQFFVYFKPSIKDNLIRSAFLQFSNESDDLTAKIKCAVFISTLAKLGVRTENRLILHSCQSILSKTRLMKIDDTNVRSLFALASHGSSYYATFYQDLSAVTKRKEHTLNPDPQSNTESCGIDLSPGTSGTTRCGGNVTYHAESLQPCSAINTLLFSFLVHTLHQQDTLTRRT